MNSGNLIAAVRRFLHVRWELSCGAAVRHYQERRGLFLKTAREVVLVLSLLLFIYFLFTAPNHLMEALGVAILMGSIAFIFAIIPVVVGDTLLRIVPRIIISLAATFLFYPPTFFQSETLDVLLSPPRICLAA